MNRVLNYECNCRTTNQNWTRRRLIYSVDTNRNMKRDSHSIAPKPNNRVGNNLLLLINNNNEAIYNNNCHYCRKIDLDLQSIVLYFPLHPLLLLLLLLITTVIQTMPKIPYSVVHLNTTKSENPDQIYQRFAYETEFNNPFIFLRY